MKYIVVEMPMGFIMETFPILFPDVVDHNSMVPAGATAISAGFVDINIDSDGVHVHGRSVTLGLEHNETDSKLIGRAINARRC